MAESNATQVILTDDGIKIIKAQNTADNAAGGVNDLNNPNLMSVIEKQTAAKQFAGLTSQYNVILARAKDDNISTTDLTTAYTNLDTFITPLLKDTTKASNIDRYTYNSLTYAYNTALSNVQTALKDSFNADIDNMHSSVLVASQAASNAVIVASQAAITGDNANQVASRAIVAANDAQSAGNNAISVANTASQAASGAIIAGSQAAVNADKAVKVANQAKSAGDNATSVANNASQAASGAVIAGSQAEVTANKASQTADQAKSAGDDATSVANTATSVANSAKSTADSTYAYANSEIAVQSTATAKAQSTADNAFSQATTAIDNGKVTSQAVTDLKDGSKLTIAELENGLATKVANSDYASYKEQTASQIGQLVTNGAFSAYQTQTANLIAQKVATSDFTAYQATTAKSIESKVESKDFNSYKQQTDKAIISRVESKDFQTLQTQVNNSAVGTNLLLGTKDFDNLSSWADYNRNWNIITDTYNGLSIVQTNQDWRGLSQYTQVSAGETYTFSVYARYVSGTGTSTFYIVLNNDPENGHTAANVSPSHKNASLTSDWQRVSVTFTITSDGWIKPRIERTSTNKNTLQICGMKLEKGSVATDWSLNPEDQATKSQITQLSGEIDLRVTKGDLVDQINVQAGKTLISSSGQLILSGKSVVLDSVDPVVMKSANIGNMAVGTAQIEDGAITNAQIGSLAVDTANIKDAAISSAKIANLAVGTAQIGDGAITNAKIGKLAVGTAQIANGAITDAQIGSLAVGTAQIKDEAVNSAKIAKLAVGTAQIGDGAITNAKIGKLAVGTAQIANAAITDAQVGNVSANKLTAGTIDFNTITGKNINASNIATGKLSTERLNVDKLSAVSANLGDITTGTLKGVNIVAKTFSTPNGSFTTDANGNVVAKNMTLNGGTLTSPTINAGVINGSTINGTTFNAGTKLNQFGNTSYPLTINQDGSVTSMSFGAIANDPAALRTVIKDGSVKTNFRGMKQLSTGIYPAADIALGAGQLALLEGYSTSQDPNFTATGMKTTGFAILDASTGLSLHGTTQSINFSGKDQDQTTGITMDSYGNIIGKPNASWWRITSNSGSNIANFGIDRAGSNVIQFNRELDIGNFHINTGHTFTSADGGAIHFAKGRGGANDIYAGDVHYNSLTKSSLLSVKKDVKKADTAYWAQLVNSIDLATYQYKTDDNTSHIRLSSIVDDVNDTKQWQLPDVFISRDEDGKLCGVDDSVLLNATLATVQEQQKEIDQLNGHNMELEARLNKLEAKLNG